MPELPEVEIAARNLTRWLRGKTITSAHIPESRVLRGRSARAITAALVGRKVLRVDRRGKWLRLSLDDDKKLFLHFGMSGRVVRRATSAPAERSERARVDVGATPASRASIRYLDPRMFGHLSIESEDVAAWTELGPDPLVDGIDTRTFAEALGRSSRAIKDVLLDQTVLAGIGNIQATEALWLARIDPRRRARSLEVREVGALARGILRSIGETLARDASPEVVYVRDAAADNPFRIYGRAGEPCPRCGAPLARVVQGGRATVFCPGCQR